MFSAQISVHRHADQVGLVSQDDENLTILTFLVMITVNQLPSFTE